MSVTHSVWQDFTLSWNPNFEKTVSFNRRRRFLQMGFNFLVDMVRNPIVYMSVVSCHRYYHYKRLQNLNVSTYGQKMDASQIGHKIFLWITVETNGHLQFSNFHTLDCHKCMCFLQSYRTINITVILGWQCLTQIAWFFNFHQRFN